MENLTLYGAVKRSAQSNKKSPALYYMGKSISYGALLSEINALSGWLYERGIKRGDAVTLCMPNIPQCVIAFYAVNKIGAIAHMVHPLAPSTQLWGYMQSVKSKMLIIPDIMLKDHQALVGKTDILICSPAYYLGAIKNKIYSWREKTTGLEDESRRIFRYARAIKCATRVTSEFTDAKATAVYLHSGGTGGLPKTIELSSFSINALCGKGCDILCESPKGKYMLAVLPMFHGFGLAMGVHALLILGGCDTLMPKFHTAETIKLIKKNKINYIIGVPTLFEALLKKPEFSGKSLQNIRRAFVGGDFVPKRLIEEFNARMAENGSLARLSEGYGLTETVTVCAVNTASESKEGSIGKPVKGLEIAAFEDGKRLSAGEQGELCVSGDTLMNGYLNDGSGTEAAFFDYEGKRFVRTGDIGFVDEEGYAFFKSRIKRIVKVSGITVFPSEIENLCMNELAQIREACTVADKDERTGESIVMFVSLNGELDGKEKEELKERIAALVEERLSRYAVPKMVFFVSELPKTLVGKVDSNKLKEIYLK